MSAFNTANILDLIDLVGEEEVEKILSDFSCEKNMEIEFFVKKSAIDFSKKKSRLHILFLMKKWNWRQCLL